ncbi:MAG: c-type cytochrome domain-containing protein [Candidatus Delongbacteria bacterium]
MSPRGGLLLSLLCLGGLAGCADLGDEPGTTPVDGDVSFSRDVQPILQGNCTLCHGADGSSGGLDLGSLAGLRAGGVSGAVVVAGAADSSLLVARLEESNPALRMPAGGQLPALQIDVIRDWIDQGAVDN